MAALPQKQMSLRELNDQRQQLLTALSLMDARRKEAEFFINNPPGYWKIFQRPELRDVSVRSQPLKALLLAFAAFGGGLALALILSITWELRQPGLRTPLQAAIASRTRPVLLFESGQSGDASILDRWWGRERKPVNDPPSEVLRFWLTEMARPEPPYPCALFVAVNPLQQVRDLMDMMVEVAGQDSAPVVMMPLSEDAVRYVPDLPSFTGQMHGAFVSRELVADAAVAEALMDGLCRRAHVIILATEQLRTRDFKVLKLVDQAYLLATPGVSTSQGVRFRADVMSTVRGPLHGLILVGPVLQRTLQRLLFRLQMYYFNLRNRAETVV